MSRKIIIDSDTVIGYDYPNTNYYIMNKGTTTTRTTAQNAFNVLKIVAGENPVDIDGNPVNLARVSALETTYETLNSLFFTWEDTGAYIATIQLNDWAKYPLSLNAHKEKIYIMNTEIIYDLSLNEAPSQRLGYIQSFYLNQLGLSISIEDLSILYNLLVSYYYSQPYNVFKRRTINSATGQYSPLQYSNIIEFQDFSKKVPATYTLTLNPNAQYTKNTIAHILSLQNKVITLTSPPTTPVEVDDRLTISNSYTDVENTEYSADGTYTVTGVNTANNTITVSENFPTPYIYTPTTFNLVAYKTNITKISREDRTITLSTNVPDGYVIGDVIRVQGANIQTTYEALTADGTFTIINISGHTITVNETPTYDYEYTTGTRAYVFKNIVAGDISSINQRVITLSSSPSIALGVAYPMLIAYNNGTEAFANIVEVNTHTLTYTMDVALEDFTANYGLLQTTTPYPEVLIQVENSTDTEVLPNGTFEVDTHEQCTQYLSLLNTLLVPTEEVYNNSEKYVSSTYTIGEGTVQTMTCLGLYSEVYSDKVNN